MKKVLIISTIKDTIESFLIPHIKHLEKLGYKVDIACNTRFKPLSGELCMNKCYHFDFSRSPFSKGNIKSFSGLRQLIKREDYDFIYLHTPIAAFLGRMAAAALKGTTVYMAHGFHFYRGAPLINWLIYYPLERIAMFWTDAVITINEEDYENAKKMAPKRTRVYKVNGVGIDLETYSSGNKNKILDELNLDEKDFIVTNIGELNRNKNQIQIIKALEELTYNFKLLVVGSGCNEQKLKDYVNLKKLNDRVFFLGLRSDIQDIIATSHVLASMSYREGLPRCVMEGMAQGKPFVATNIRGNRDLIKEGRNGFLTEPDNYKDTADKIKLLRDSGLLQAIKENNLEDIQNYSNERVLKEIEDIFLQKGGH